VPDEILGYYALGEERARLEQGPGLLEKLRTEELLGRFLPPPPARVLDVGGGTGPYALRLARAGYEVHLIDVVPLHVEQAREASARQPEAPLASARVGDARGLDWPEAAAGAVLLLGPLYHLTDRAQRIRALQEAGRVLRPGGVLLGAAISRFASLLDALRRERLSDAAFAAIVARDLQDGQHRNPTSRPEYFTTAFFHHPEELRAEAVEAGLAVAAVLAIEGPAWLVPDLEARLADAGRRAELLSAVRAAEAEPSLLGVSAHLLAVARKEG
jgi:SAM-dependent methyltransferase